jgi:hypothetical protein
MPVTKENLHQLLKLLPYSSTYNPGSAAHDRFVRASYAYANLILEVVPAGTDREAAFGHFRNAFLSGAAAIKVHEHPIAADDQEKVAKPKKTKKLKEVTA